MPAKREAKNIECKLLLTVAKEFKKEGQLAIVIRVVDWVSEGKHTRLMEKREFYPDGEGGWKMGKAKGFSIADLQKVQDQWGEIMTALGSKLPEHQVSPGVAPADPAPAVGADTPREDF